jgi:hypothetical protein
MIGSTRDISPPRFSHESAVSRMLDRYIPFYAILIGHYNHVLNVYTNRIPRVQHATLVLILLAASQKPLRIASLQRALNTLGYFLYYTRKNKNHPQASGIKRTRKVCYVQKVLACASIRVELTIHHPPPSRRSFPACATNASTISERGDHLYKPFSLDPLFWQRVGNKRQIRWSRSSRVPLLSRVRHRPKNYRYQKYKVKSNLKKKIKAQNSKI